MNDSMRRLLLEMAENDGSLVAGQHQHPMIETALNMELVKLQTGAWADPNSYILTPKGWEAAGVSQPKEWRDYDPSLVQILTWGAALMAIIAGAAFINEVASALLWL